MLFGSPKQAKECVQMPYDANKYGAALYHTLREADKQQPKHIYIEIPPSTPEWGAIQDRLSRSVAK
jgi:L-threonylcarbamoyladenylate synthase